MQLGTGTFFPLLPISDVLPIRSKIFVFIDSLLMIKRYLSRAVRANFKVDQERSA
jgi:hypothetical protein